MVRQFGLDGINSNVCRVSREMIRVAARLLGKRWASLRSTQPTGPTQAACRVRPNRCIEETSLGKSGPVTLVKRLAP